MWRTKRRKDTSLGGERMKVMAEAVEEDKKEEDTSFCGERMKVTAEAVEEGEGN